MAFLAAVIAVCAMRANAIHTRVSRVGPARVPVPCVRMMPGAAEIQFLKGTDETVVPDIRLTRAKDGLTGTATFVFDQPDFLLASTGPQDEITGMYMVDDEGEMVTTDVSCKFINGSPRFVEAVFIMRDPPTWDRVMRFLVRRERTAHPCAWSLTLRRVACEAPGFSPRPPPIAPGASRKHTQSRTASASRAPRSPKLGV